MSEQGENLNTPVIIPVERIRPGQIIFRAPGNLIVPDALPTGVTLEDFKTKSCSLLVLAVEENAPMITVTYTTSFDSAKKIADVTLQGEVDAQMLFVPIIPAGKEFTHDPIKWTSYDRNTPASWVSVRSKMVIKDIDFKVMDATKFFDEETAAAINNRIRTVVTENELGVTVP